MMIAAREWTLKEPGGENENGTDSLCNLVWKLWQLHRGCILSYCNEQGALKNQKHVESIGFVYSIWIA